MKIKSLYLYLIFAVWLVLILTLLFPLHLRSTGLGITLAFLTMILTPGALISRLVNLKGTFLVKLLYSFAFGLGFYFLINLGAIFLNLTITHVLIIDSVIIFILLVSSLIKDREHYLEIDMAKFIKDKSWVDWAFYTVILAGSILAFWAINAQSDKLLGDGYFHLAILRKVVSGDGLSSFNLWVTKTDTLNPVYSFPLWHILVGAFSRLLDISIFTAFRQVLLPLAIIALVVWYGLTTIIFKNKYISWTVYLTFLLVFLKDNVFYYLVALASPDTLGRLLLLPLLFSLIIHFLFEKESPKIINIVLISLLAVLTGLIHFTQLIYLVLILIGLGILLLIFDRDHQKPVKLAYLLGGIGVLILPYLLIIQHGLISIWFNANRGLFQGDIYENKSPGEANITYRYAVLSLPFLALYFKKNSRLILVVAVTLVSMLISWQIFGLRELLLKNLGQIFVERSIANIPTFLFIGFLIFLILNALNYFFSKNKIIGYLANAIAIVILFSSIFIEKVHVYLVQFSNLIFNSDSIIFGKYFWVIFTFLVIVAVVIYFRKKNFEISEPSDKSNFAVFLIVLLLILSLPYWPNLKKVLAANPNGTILSDRSVQYVSDISVIGGQKTLDFFNSVPDRSVFLTDNPNFSQMILLYSNNLAAEYPYSIQNFTSSELFYSSNNLASKKTILDQLKVNYILVRHEEELQFYLDHPDSFKQVFENHYVYQVPRTLVIFKYLK